MQVIGAAATMVMFFCILSAFVPLGQILGRTLDKSTDSIRAYSINIVASLLGMWAFNALSFFYTPPWAWWLTTIALTGLLMACLHRDEPTLTS